MAEIERLKRENAELRALISEQRRDNAELRELITELRHDNETLKAQLGQRAQAQPKHQSAEEE